MRRENFDIFDIIFHSGQETVEQDRKEWLGGSDVAKMSNNYSIYRTFVDKMNENFFKNKYTENGHLTEPETRKFVNEKLGINFIPCCIYDDELKLRANTDGFFYDTENDKSFILEIKNNNKDTSYINFEKYYIQIQFYLYMYDADYAYLAELDRIEDENGDFLNEVNNSTVTITPIARNEKVIDKIIEKIEMYNKIKENGDFNSLFYKDKDIEKFYENNNIEKIVENSLLKKELETKKEILKEILINLKNDNIKTTTRNYKPSFKEQLFFDKNKEQYSKYIAEKLEKDIPFSLTFNVNRKNNFSSNLYVESIFNKQNKVDDFSNFVYEEYKKINDELKVVDKELKTQKENLINIVNKEFPEGVIFKEKGVNIIPRNQGSKEISDKIKQDLKDDIHKYFDEGKTIESISIR